MGTNKAFFIANEYSDGPVEITLQVILNRVTTEKILYILKRSPTIGDFYTNLKHTTDVELKESPAYDAILQATTPRRRELDIFQPIENKPIDIEISMLHQINGQGYQNGFAKSSNTIWVLPNQKNISDRKPGEQIIFMDSLYELSKVIAAKGQMGPRYILKKLDTKISTLRAPKIPRTLPAELKVNESMLNGYTGSGYVNGFAASSNTAWFRKGLSEVDSKEIGDLVTFKGKEYTIKSIIPGKGGMGPRFVLTPKE